MEAEPSLSCSDAPASGPQPSRPTPRKLILWALDHYDSEWMTAREILHCLAHSKQPYKTVCLNLSNTYIYLGVLEEDGHVTRRRDPEYPGRTLWKAQTTSAP